MTQHRSRTVRRPEHLPATVTVVTSSSSPRLSPGLPISVPPGRHARRMIFGKDSTSTRMKVRARYRLQAEQHRQDFPYDLLRHQAEKRDKPFHATSCATCPTCGQRHRDCREGQEETDRGAHRAARKAPEALRTQAAEEQVQGLWWERHLRTQQAEGPVQGLRQQQPLLTPAAEEQVQGLYHIQVHEVNSLPAIFVCACKPVYNKSRENISRWESIRPDVFPASRVRHSHVHVYIHTYMSTFTSFSSTLSVVCGSEQRMQASAATAAAAAEAGAMESKSPQPWRWKTVIRTTELKMMMRSPTMDARDCAKPLSLMCCLSPASAARFLVGDK